jgi:hypothetical protein
MAHSWSGVSANVESRKHVPESFDKNVAALPAGIVGASVALTAGKKRDTRPLRSCQPLVKGDQISFQDIFLLTDEAFRSFFPPICTERGI